MRWPELNLKGKFGSPRWPGGRGRSVPGQEPPEPRRGGPSSQRVCWALLGTAGHRDIVTSWASSHCPPPPCSRERVLCSSVSGFCQSVSLAYPCHKCFLSLALPGLESEGRSRPFTLCEADGAGSGTPLIEKTEAWSGEVTSPSLSGSGP